MAPVAGVAARTSSSKALFGVAVVDVRVRTADIAEGALQTMALLLEDEPLVELRLEDAPRDRDSELERHVEARGPWRGAGELHAAQIVDRVAALLHQANDPVQATARPGDLKCCAGKKAKRT
jgi:hypothetical protein